MKAFAVIASIAVAVAIPFAARSEVPDVVKLKAGAPAYFGIGGATTACPTVDRYIEWLQSTQADKSRLCPAENAGQRVTVIRWKPYSLNQGPTQPLVDVRFADGRSGWTLAVAPVVPPGTTVLISDENCAAEAARNHVKLSNLPTWRSVCRAVVVKQLVSSSRNTLVAKFLGSGQTISVAAATALVPKPLLPDGLPRYNLQFFAPPQ